MTSVPDVTLYGAAVNRIGSVDLAVVRPPRGVTNLEPTTSGVRSIRLVVPVDEGIAVRTPDGAQIVVGRHDLAWVPRWRAAAVVLARPTALAIVDVPAEEFERRGIRLAHLPPRTHPTSPLVRPVREFLLSAIDNAHAVPPLSAHLFERMLCDMVESLMLESRGMPWGRARSRSALHDQAVAHITAFRASPDLTPAQVAQTLRVSLRQLQRVFEEAGSSVAAEIRAQRAEAAIGMLQDPEFDVVKIPEIAQRAGFANDAELRRAVVARSGRTPAQLRRDRRS